MGDIHKSDQQSPYFKMYPRDFFSSSRVARMNADEQGTYALLLFREWLDGYIPANTTEIAELLGLSVDILDERWKRISRCYISVEGEPDKLINKRLEEERRNMIDRGEKLSERGRKAGKASAAARQNLSISEQHVDACQQQFNNTSTQVNHADADANADADTDERAAEAPTLADPCELTPQSKGAKKNAEHPAKKREWESDSLPHQIRHEWPTEATEFAQLVAGFVTIFGNAASPEALTKFKPGYSDALAQMKNRRGSTVLDAWRAFRACRQARDGKPLFGAQAKSAISYLTISNVTPINAYSRLATSSSGAYHPSDNPERGWIDGQPVSHPDRKKPNGWSQTTPKGVTTDEARAWLRNGILPAKFAQQAASS